MHVFLNAEGFVCCSLDGKNKAFLHDCYGVFSGRQGGTLFMARFNTAKQDWAYPEVGACNDYLTLNDLITSAERHHINVDKGVYDLREKLKKGYDEVEERQAKKEAERKAKERWRHVCKRGCLGCEMLGYDGDDPYCRESGNYLEGVWTSLWDNFRGVHVFGMIPQPDENCKYYYNEGKNFNYPCRRALQELA